MIEVEYTKGKTAHELSIAGHADYDSQGKDIVCAGVSAIAYSLMGYLDKHGGEFEADSGEFYCTAERLADTDVAFEVALIGLELIAESYPHHVEVYKTAAPGC